MGEKIKPTIKSLRKRQWTSIFKKKGLGYKSVAREMGIDDTLVRRWVKRFEAEGVKGLEEKREKTKGPGIGRPRTRPEDPEVKIKRLEAENEMLKKLLRM